MKDELSGLFQERFTGHEVDVPPGAWEAISTQVAANTGGEALRQALQDKFSGHEMHVDPGVWQGISAQLGTGAAAAGGATLGGGWLAAGVAAVLITGGALFWVNSGKDATRPPVAATTPTTPAPVPAAPAPAPATAAPVQRTPEAAPQPTPPTPAPQEKARPKATVPKAALAKPVPADHPAVASTDPAPTPAPAQQLPPTGTGVVNAVLQQLVAANAAKPEPTHQEAVPPVSPKDMPAAEVKPEPANVPPPPTEEPKAAVEPNLYIPNVFSPNGDGVNDVLEVKGGPFQDVQVRIFSAKTGGLVFSANTLTEGWNGLLPDGQRAEDGYYFYAIEVVGDDGRAYPKREVVRLFR